MKAAIVALSALIGMTACNKEEAKRDAAQEEDRAARAVTEEQREAQKEGDQAVDKIQEEARQTQRDIGEAADKATDKVREETRQSTRDIKEGADKAASKTGEETRQASRDAKEGVAAAGEKGAKETRQGTRDLKASMGMDDGKTDADDKLISRIREALKADGGVAAEARDIRITANEGKVNLEGTVTSKSAKDEIARIAGAIAGKTKVDDDLKVAERVGAGAQD